MRVLLLLLLLAGCPRKEPQEPALPPPVPDAGGAGGAAAAAIDASPTPMQTPLENTTIRASSYAQNCTRDDECIGVFEGDACNPCRCAWNAIRKDAFPRYKSDLGQFWSCHKPDDCQSACRQITGDAAKCEAGTCILPP